MPTSVNPPDNATDMTAAADALLRRLIAADFPLSMTSPELEEVLALYPLSAFTDNHARAAAIFQDVVFAW